MSSSQARDQAAELRTLVAALALVLMPFPVILVNLAPHKGAYAFQAIVFPSDVAMVVLLAVTAPALWHERSRLGWALNALALLWLLLAISFAVHPSTRGALDVIRVATTIALAWTIARTTDRTHRHLLLGAFMVTAVVQAAIAVIQIATRSDVGLGALGEFPEPFYRFGASALAPQGTMVHIYVLAGLALVAAAVAAAMWASTHRRGWLVAAPAAAVPVGFTYSRAAALGLGAAVVVLVAGSIVIRRRALLLAAVALVVGPLVVGTVWPDGWSARVASVRSVRRERLSVDAATSGRTVLMRQARDLLESEPLFGVGTGRYTLELEARHVDVRQTNGVYKPVHDVPLMIAAEAGVLAGAVVIALLVLLGWHAIRAGPATLALFVAYMPYVLLDHFPYSFPQGLITTGVWIGVIELMHRDRVRQRGSADLA